MVGCRRFFVLVLLRALCSNTAAADAPPRPYFIQTAAGSDFVGDGGPALAAVFSQTEGIAVDSLGTIYVADADDNRVRKITPDGIVQTVAGAGIPGFSGDGGPATSALLSHPYGIALDASGNLYIADLGNGRVRKVSMDGNIQTVAGGGAAAPGHGGDGGPATGAQLNQPRNVALDSDGTLYISDFGAHRVYAVSPGGILTMVAGTGTAGFSGDGASAQLAQLKAPAGLASDGHGSLYIADSGNNRIRKVFQGVIGTAYNVTAPTGVAVSAGGTVYIAAAGYLGTVSNAIAGIPGAFDVAVDSSGNVYATDGQFVRKAASDGTITTVAGSGASRYYAGDNGPAAIARLHAPSGIAVDAGGNVYVADTANHRIRKITAQGVITTIAGTGNAGSSGDNGPAALAQLNAPRGVAIDAQNNVYIADSGNNEIRKITPAGTMLSVTVDVSNPASVAAGPDGSLYVADTGNNQVIQIDPAGATHVVSPVSQPAAVALDAGGNLLVSDPARVSKITPGGAISVVVDGLHSPDGLIPTLEGGLLIAETGANVVRLWTAAGTLTTIAGTGVAGFSGDGGPAAAAQLNSPSGLAVDANGTIWIADSGNNRIRTLTPAAAADAVSALAVVNAATMGPGPIAPGEIVTVFGSGFDPTQTELQFDGQPAIIFYASAGQINALAPAALAPGSNTKISVNVKGAELTSMFVPVVAAVPGLFTTGNGTGPAAANNQDGSINSSSNPAARGSIVSLYGTGGGKDLSTVIVNIGDYPAEVLYAGPAPGFPGLMQINTRVPGGFLQPGLQPVAVAVGNAITQPGVTIAVR